ncbi:MAG: beta-ketoacyl-ACP synthase II [Candidatus Coatesbacteria bacterium]
MTDTRARGHRVVVTGLGMITPVGHTVAESWEALLKGVSGLGPVTLFDATPFASRIGCEVKNFEPSQRLDRKEAKRTDRFAQFALWATDEAWKDSGLDAAKEDVSRIGVIIGSGIGGFQTLEDQHTTLVQKGQGRVSPFVIPMLISNMAAGLVSIRLGVKGPNMAIVTACASGAHSIGEAARIVERGDADVMVAGGAESTLTPFGYAGFCNMGALSTRNDAGAAASCPFDARRDGFVMGEGGGIVVLESLEHAQARGARIHAELIGYAASGDAHHMTAPDPEGTGAALAMRNALADARVTPAELGYINAHGTSTQLNDKGETMAIKIVLGEHARKVPISSTKSMTGHMLGAAGAVEAVVSIRALETGLVPPTANYEVPDPACDLDYVPNKAREVKAKVAMSNSFGFGGHNAVLVFRSWPN